MPQCSVYGCTRMGGHKFPKNICVKIVGFGIKPATDWQSGNFMATGNCRTRLFSSF